MKVLALLGLMLPSSSAFAGFVFVVTPAAVELFGGAEWEPGARLVGVYFGGNRQLHLREDHTYSITRMEGEGDVESREIERGTWHLEGGNVVFSSASGATRSMALAEKELSTEISDGGETFFTLFDPICPGY